MVFNDEQRAFIVQKYFEFDHSIKNVQTAFEQRFPNRSIPCKRTIQSIVNKFTTSNTLTIATRRRNARVLTGQKLEEIQGQITANNQTSTRRIARLTGISQSSAARGLRKLNLKPYKISQQQQLLPSDLPQRHKFSKWLIRFTGRQMTKLNTF